MGAPLQGSSSVNAAQTLRVGRLMGAILQAKARALLHHRRAFEADEHRFRGHLAIRHDLIVLRQ